MKTFQICEACVDDEKCCVIVYIAICKVLYHKLIAVLRCIYPSVDSRNFKFLKIFFIGRLASFQESLNPVNFFTR